MQIFVNNHEIEINDKITHIQINEYDKVKINSYSNSFKCKLDNGSLVLSYNNSQIRIHNITNVINTTNASIDFFDYKIESMDDLFNIIKDSLSDDFYIDLEGIMSDLDEPSIDLDPDEEIIDTNINSNNTNLIEDNKKLLIVVSTTNANSIYNFALFYAKNTLLSNSWLEIEIIFYGESIITVLNDVKIKDRIKELVKRSVGIKFSEFSSNEPQDNIVLNELGIKGISNDDILTNALKSTDWEVLTV